MPASQIRRVAKTRRPGNRQRLGGLAKTQRVGNRQLAKTKRVENRHLAKTKRAGNRHGENRESWKSPANSETLGNGSAFSEPPVRR